MPWRNPFNYPGPRNPDGTVKTWQMVRDRHGNPLPEPHVWMYEHPDYTNDHMTLTVQQGARHVQMEWTRHVGWTVNGRNLHARSWGDAARHALETAA
jgi:hypothetical protein